MTGDSAPGNRNSASRSSSDTAPGSSVIPRSAGTTEDEVPSTSRMRPAHTEARGPIMSTQEPIITAMRIWMR